MQTSPADAIRIGQGFDVIRPQQALKRECIPQRPFLAQQLSF